ncbi:MAG: PilZ domain-containing protein [Planctomycetes bacterium]|nr:PilZ domain-containing protein [Planctomycetota bacterium]
MVIRVERRREPRERTYQLVNVSPVNAEGLPTEQLLGRTLDLSRGGARVEVPHEVSAGARVRVDLALHEALVSTEAEVRYVGTGDEGEWLLGLEFVGLDDAAAGRIGEFLRARGAARGRG